MSQESGFKFMKKLICLLLFLLPSFNSFGQTNSEKLTNTLGEMQKKSNFIGYAVAVVNQNGVLYKKGFGLANVANNKAYTPQTIQPVGSVSKTFIGVALMKAVESGMFSLGTNINDILPFKVYNPNFPDAEIKIRHLATHTSGIVDREEIYEKSYSNTKIPDVSLKEFLTNYFDEKGKNYSKDNFAGTMPGEAFNYTNIGAALAAYLIEIKSGMSFADYTKKVIFRPLHLNNSAWFYNDLKSKNYAVLYNAKREPLPIYSLATYPDGGLKTSVEDLSKYLTAIIKGYAGNGKVLSKDSFQTLLSKQFTSANSPTNINLREPNQGIFFAHRANGQIGHTGSDPGVSVFMFFNPKTKIGKIFMTNVDITEDKNLVTQFTDIWKILEEYETRLK